MDRASFSFTNALSKKKLKIYKKNPKIKSVLKVSWFSTRAKLKSSTSGWTVKKPMLYPAELEAQFNINIFNTDLIFKEKFFTNN